MSVFRLEYPLADGYVHNWLVAGPQAISSPDLDRSQEQDAQQPGARDDRERDSGITQPPVDGDSFAVGDTDLTWRYWRCLDDHYVDLSAACQPCHSLRSCAYTQVTLADAQALTLTLTATGPADLWLNGQHIHRQEQLQGPASVSFQGTFSQGDNDILVRFQAGAGRECTHAMALRIAGPPAVEMTIGIPTRVRRTIRQQMFERGFEQAHLEQYVHYKGNRILLHWADDLDTRFNYACQIQDARQRIYVEALPEAQPSETQDMGHLARIWEGAYDAVLKPRPEEYYEYNLRYERRIPIHVLDNPYSDALYGTFAERRTEALEHAAKRGRGVFAEIAKMALDRWDDVDHDALTETIEAIRQHSAGIDQAMGLLSIVYRYQDAAAFPEALGPAIKECLLGQRYGCDTPEQDAACCEAESYNVMAHTCEILAGQRYPDHTFGHTGQTGEWHREKAEQQALDWLRERGTMGFADWDAPDSFEQILAALSLLVDFCGNEQVQELAAVLMDKVLFTIALNSFKGVFGSTHRRANTSTLKSGQMEATSGISRLLWGMGVWNHHATGVVSLACTDYEMPLIVADIAVNLADEMWNLEHHPGVDKVTYRTPDYMLCSAQDYRPGQRGNEEHIWQATMGPDAVVFVNHPSYMSEADAHRANFWRGNSALPRVAQWKDALVAIHKLPEDDWLGFTHAHFPVYAFDEHVLQDGWAFARKGAAYLALYASQDLELVRRGPGAYRELRSYGQDNAWLCLLGRPDTDGSFGDFQRKVRALDVGMQGLTVRCTTLRGDKLSFGWEGPLAINGEVQPLDGYPHYDNPFCTVELPAREMEIRTSDYLLRLRFAPE